MKISVSCAGYAIAFVLWGNRGNEMKDKYDVLVIGPVLQVPLLLLRKKGDVLGEKRQKW